MKRIVILFLAVTAGSGSALGMTRTNDAGDSKRAVSATGQQSGKLGAVHAGAGKLVIDGVTYAYSPLTTVVVIDGKRGSMSDLKPGNTVQFQSAAQGASQPPLLMNISVQKR